MQRTMRAEDFRGMMALKEDAEKVRRLVDGRTQIPMLNHRREGYDLMNVTIDAHLTTLQWSPVVVMATPDALHRQGQTVQTLNLEDVVSIVPWTHKLPTKKPSMTELEMAKKGARWYFGLCVAYPKRHRTQQLTMLCTNAAEQEQLVASFRTLTRAAKQRQSALQLLERTKLEYVEPVRPTTTVHRPSIPSSLGHK
ncbi:hypothetical protein B5M09_000972 [Aphanomyces astaci]|uniref:Uncharacterized protein n=1 Tax=Aphanomyces astaci TaxID=112090 RepID=A0A3R7X2G8_APHAT|nr:hypothetical protein B5M09_000972 [Aphanomyces astaci]